MNEKLFQYSEVDLFLDKYIPLTPYGKKDKSEKRILKTSEKLNEIFDNTEKAVFYIKLNPEAADRVEYHEKRIPELCDTVSIINIDSEIFNVKKFLINYRAISAILSSDIKDFFQLHFHSEKLLGMLSPDNNEDETFYIADEYSDDLKQIRIEINQINSRLTEIKEKKINEIKKDFLFDFRFHDFLVVDEKTLPRGADQFIYVEPYDNNFIVIKPILGKEFFEVHNSRKDLIDREKLIENRIKEDLRTQINEERQIINHYEETLRILDTSFAKARLAISFDAVRPRFTETGNLLYKNCVLIPLKERIQKKKSIYTPLTVNFNERNIVINGSNMGGKTILLKTILFSQLLVQMGFYIPAEEIHTTVFESINLIGNINKDSLHGLSSFGEEIMNLIDSENTGNTLYIIDEFAKTTNSEEGKALYCAILKWFSETKDVRSFSTTHHDKLPDFKNLAYWIMKGLDYNKYHKHSHKDYNSDLNDRILLINDFMDYQVIPQDKTHDKKDALKIADILGLNSRLIAYANEYINEKE